MLFVHVRPSNLPYNPGFILSPLLIQTDTSCLFSTTAHLGTEQQHLDFVIQNQHKGTTCEEKDSMCNMMCNMQGYWMLSKIGQTQSLIHAQYSQLQGAHFHNQAEPCCQRHPNHISFPSQVPFNPPIIHLKKPCQTYVRNLKYSNLTLAEYYCQRLTCLLHGFWSSIVSTQHHISKQVNSSH